MFGSKRHLQVLADGTQARHSGYFPQFAQPQVGNELWVRYDPGDHSRFELDPERIAADNAAIEAAVAARAASGVPAEIAANGILGRGAVVDVTRTQLGALVDCEVTLGVRLIDGSAPYRASCHVLLPSEQAEQLRPGSTLVTVRADPHNHTRIALSLTEATPVVTVTDPRALEPAARALRYGLPCCGTILAYQRQLLQTRDGDEFYALSVRIDSDGAEIQANQPVPRAVAAQLHNGMRVAARRLAGEPAALAIEWAESGPSSAATSAQGA